jgi:hypothetical protein
LIVLIISALKRKVLFALRLCLLVIILVILTIQIYSILKIGTLSPVDPVTVLVPEPQGFLENTINWFKEYYRGNLR